MRQMIKRRFGRRTALRFAADDRGTTAIEYSILAGGIALALVAVVLQMGGVLKTNYYDKLLGLF